MRGIHQLIATIGLLGVALLPMLAAVPPDPKTSALEARMPVAIAQPLGTPAHVLRTPLPAEGTATLPEPGMLVLVGSALLGLAAVVRKTT